jgi:hypothetical protein
MHSNDYHDHLQTWKIQFDYKSVQTVEEKYEAYQ